MTNGVVLCICSQAGLFVNQTVTFSYHCEVEGHGKGENSKMLSDFYSVIYLIYKDHIFFKISLHVHFEKNYYTKYPASVYFSKKVHNSC